MASCNNSGLEAYEKRVNEYKASLDFETRYYAYWETGQRVQRVGKEWIGVSQETILANALCREFVTRPGWKFLGMVYNVTQSELVRGCPDHYGPCTGCRKSGLISIQTFCKACMYHK